MITNTKFQSGQPDWVVRTGQKHPGRTECEEPFLKVQPCGNGYRTSLSGGYGEFGPCVRPEQDLLLSKKGGLPLLQLPTAASKPWFEDVLSKTGQRCEPKREKGFHSPNSMPNQSSRWQARAKAISSVSTAWCSRLTSLSAAHMAKSAGFDQMHNWQWRPQAASGVQEMPIAPVPIMEHVKIEPIPIMDIFAGSAWRNQVLDQLDPLSRLGNGRSMKAPKPEYRERKRPLAEVFVKIAVGVEISFLCAPVVAALSVAAAAPFAVSAVFPLVKCFCLTSFSSRYPRSNPVAHRRAIPGGSDCSRHGWFRAGHCYGRGRQPDRR